MRGTNCKVTITGRLLKSSVGRRSRKSKLNIKIITLRFNRRVCLFIIFTGKHDERLAPLCLGEHVERSYRGNFIRTVIVSHFEKGAVYIFERAAKQAAVPRKRSGVAGNKYYLSRARRGNRLYHAPLHTLSGRVADNYAPAPLRRRKHFVQLIFRFPANIKHFTLQSVGVPKLVRTARSLLHYLYTVRRRAFFCKHCGQHSAAAVQVYYYGVFFRFRKNCGVQL